jgi:hypothetical protein
MAEAKTDVIRRWIKEMSVQTHELTATELLKQFTGWCASNHVVIMGEFTINDIYNTLRRDQLKWKKERRGKNQPVSKQRLIRTWLKEEKPETEKFTIWQLYCQCVDYLNILYPEEVAKLGDNTIRVSDIQERMRLEKAKFIHEGSGRAQHEPLVKDFIKAIDILIAETNKNI